MSRELLSNGKEKNENSWAKKAMMGTIDSTDGVTYRLDKTKRWLKQWWVKNKWVKVICAEEGEKHVWKEQKKV